MKITSLKAEDVGPIKHFVIDNLEDLVIIAGANASGKTSLKNALIGTFQSPDRPKVSFNLTPTRPEEEKLLPKSGLAIQKNIRSEELVQYMNTRIARGRYVGAPIHFDDTRVFKQYKIPPLNFNQSDPDEEEVGINFHLNTFESRFETTMHKLYQKACSRSGKIFSAVAIDGLTVKPSDFPDPLQPFIDVFSKLLPGKKLLTIDTSKSEPLHYKDEDGKVHTIYTLSSGEKEVVGIAFDLLLIRPNHSIILIDEPELHLHPQLVLKLIQILLSVGKNNQFFLFTHSGELISSFIDQQVFYIDTYDKSKNQARNIKDLTSDPDLLKVVGQNIGIFAVGKKVIFVEGEDISLDKVVYQEIANKVFPGSIVVPATDQENIMALARINNILSKSTIWGISMFMIRDKNGLTTQQIDKFEKDTKGRMKILKRRHIENYFLNEQLLSEALSDDLVDEKSEWRKKEYVLKQLRDIANEILPEAVYQWVKEIVRNNAGNVSLKVKNHQALNEAELITAIENQSGKELARISSVLKSETIEKLIKEKFSEYKTALKQNDDNIWKKEFPGKIMFRKLAGKIPSIDSSVLRRKYKKKLIQVLDSNIDEAKELVEIFKSFSKL